MGLISTPFITYREIFAGDSDLVEDAFGLKGEFPDVYSFLGSYECEHGDKAADRLLILMAEKNEHSATG